jgi:predicted ATPase/DNA-binding NarL/FixJ family response regulator/Tfp pilus assembly protein PilF
MAHILHLPLAVPDLVSRDKEVAYITGQLQGETRLLTITGPGGVGKTHLAIRTAWEMQPAFERIVFVDVSSSETGQFTQQVLQVLGLKSSDEDTLGQLAFVLSQQTTLLVIDNFETILGAAATVGQLLAKCPSLVILVTSRSPLGLRPETCTQLPPLSALPQHAPALQFFMAAAKTMNPPYDLAEHVEDSYKLCERLDGLPLALELAAACTPFMTPKALLEHLERHPSLPQLELPDRPERQKNLIAVVCSSLTLLSDNEQTFFRRLGVMVGSFSIEAAEAVTDAKALGLNALSTLVKLRNHSLLTSELTAPPRFKMLETIRTVALELLSNPDEGDAVAARTRHLHYYQTFVASHNEHLRGAAQLETLELLAREQGNLGAALRWSSQQDDLREAGAHLVVSMYRFWHLKGRIPEGHAWLETFRGTYTAPLQTEWLYAFSAAKSALAQQQEALPLAKEALHLARTLHLKVVTARILNLLGNIYRDLDHFEKALEFFQEAMTLAEACAETSLAASVLNNTGLIHKHFGRYQEAEACYLKALHVARDSGDISLQALFINNIATLKKADERIPLLEESLALLQHIGDTKRMSFGFVNLADAHYWLGNYDLSVKFSEQGLACAKQAGDRYQVGVNLNNLGNGARQQGDVARAEAYFAEALDLFKAIGSRSRKAEILCDWARCYKGDPPKAAQQFLQALEIALETKTLSVIISCLDGLAELEAREGQHEQALVLWSAAQQLVPTTTLTEWLSETLLEETKKTLEPEAARQSWQQGQTLNPVQLYQDLCKRWNVSTKKPLSDVLSLRQQDILKLVAKGHSSKKLAKVFGLSEATIKYHLKEIFNKLGVNSRAEAVAQAGQRGWL